MILNTENKIPVPLRSVEGFSEKIPRQ